ncbi:MAG: hypothetical protein GWN58_24885, partial [Anaerolineae bacterium]|nr:hypothetical protein [Anaerolineae bacterium]
MAEFYRQQPIDKVLAAVDDLFQITLQPWYEREREEQQQPMEAFCQG